MMTKKTIISSAISFACICAVGFGAVLLVKGQDREQVLDVQPPMEVEIPAGRYYHTIDGVKDEDFYIEVTEEKTIQVVCDDVKKMDLSRWDDYPEEDREAYAAKHLEEYALENEFIARYTPEIDYTGIFINWSIDNDGSFAGYGYCYADENTISWGATDGEFILE